MLPVERLSQITQRFEFLEARLNAGPAPDEIARISREYAELKPVVAQIAAQAAYETGNVGSNAGGLLGIGARRNFASRPEAQCELYGQVAVLHLDLGLVFPTPLSSTIEDLRAHVRGRVEHLTGLSVGNITIECPPSSSDHPSDLQQAICSSRKCRGELNPARFLTIRIEWYMSLSP